MTSVQSLMASDSSQTDRATQAGTVSPYATHLYRKSKITPRKKLLALLAVGNAQFCEERHEKMFRSGTTKKRKLEQTTNDTGGVLLVAASERKKSRLNKKAEFFLPSWVKKSVDRKYWFERLVNNTNNRREDSREILKSEKCLRLERQVSAHLDTLTVFSEDLAKAALQDADCARLVAGYYASGELAGIIETDIGKAISLYRKAIVFASLERNKDLETQITADLVMLLIDNNQHKAKVLRRLPRFVELLQSRSLTVSTVTYGYFVLGQVCEEFAVAECAEALLAQSLLCYQVSARASLAGSEYARLYLLSEKVDKLLQTESFDLLDDLFELTQPMQLYEWYTREEPHLTAEEIEKYDMEHAAFLHCMAVYFRLAKSDE